MENLIKTLRKAIQFTKVLSSDDKTAYLDNLNDSKDNLALLHNLKTILEDEGVLPKSKHEPIVESVEKPFVEPIDKTVDKPVVESKKRSNYVFDQLHCDINIDVAKISEDKYFIEPILHLTDKQGNYTADFHRVLGEMKDKLVAYFEKAKKTLNFKENSYKVNVILLQTYAYMDPLTEVFKKDTTFRKNILLSYEISNEHMLLTSFISKIMLGLEQKKIDFEQSGFYLLSFDKFVFNRASTTPMNGGKWFEHQKNKFCINFQNEDEKCFFYNICLFEFFTKNDRYNHKNNFKHILNWKSKFNFENITYPTSISDYELFSEQNKQNLIIFEENEGIYEIFRSNHYENCEYIGMKLIHNENKTLKHLLYITDLKGYLNQSKKQEQVFCNKCLRFYGQKEIEFHDCKEKSDKKYKYETKKSLTVKPKDYANELPTFTRVYCDFECINDIVFDVCGNKSIVQNPISVGFKVVNDFCKTLNQDVEIIHGRDCADKFLQKMVELNKHSKNAYNLLRRKYKYPKLTQKEEQEFQACRECNFCKSQGNPFDELPFWDEWDDMLHDGLPFWENDAKLVRDHCHLSGKYRQALCNTCNLNFNDYSSKKNKAGGLIILFHNSRSYDTHLIMQSLYKIITEKNHIKAIATTIDKYITFECLGMRFLDTWLFLNSSLSELCDTMEHKDFKETNKYFGVNSLFLRQKQAYPYAWLDNEEKFNNTELPKIEDFYNDLRKESLSENDYAFCKKVFEKMNCKTFLDYHKKYLECDVLTMCDIFEKFRKSHKDDPFNCPTINSLSWSLMMKKCKQPLGYIKNDYQRVFLSKGQRGGVCQTGVLKHVKANNKYMTNYKPHKPSTFIIYTDMNGLYGGVMQDEYLPYELINDEPVYISFDELMNLGDEIGCFVKLNIYYPTDEKQREYLRGYTPFPHKSETNFQHLSQEQKDYYIKNNITNENTDFFGGSKLIMDFTDKLDYVTHYKNIQYFHSKNFGFRFEPTNPKGFEVLKFKAKKWLSPYISENAEKRKNTTNEIEKALWKLCSNAIYGKMQEKVDDRKNFNITRDREKAQKLIDKNTHSMGYSLKDENQEEVLFFNLNRKTMIKYDKFQYIGNAILDLSKLHMMKYYYDYLKPKYGDKITFLYTDTDSIIFLVKTEDFYQDCYNDRHKWYDLSNVKLKNFKYDKNKGVNGKMKLEDKMIPIVEAIFLNPKVYCTKFDNAFYELKKIELIDEKNKKIKKLCEFQTVDDENRKYLIDYIEKEYAEKIESIKLDKGTKKGVTKSIHIPIEDYVEVHKTKQNKYADVTQIKSKEHKISVENINKIALTPYDTKQITIGNESRQFGF